MEILNEIRDDELPGDKDLEREDAFMKEMREIMIAHLEDEDFDINSLCSEISMSRTQIYRKFNALTNRTIAQYLRSLRLHRARELLRTTGLSVTEVAYRTSFRNVSHFSKVFRKEFNLSPSDI